MANQNKKRLVRLALAATASAFGYAYHALSQDRSVRSKLREDAYRLKSGLDYGEEEENTSQYISKRYDQYRRTSDLLSCPYADGVTSEHYSAGKVHWLDYTALEETEEVLVYFHGGKRLDHMTYSEWRMLEKLQAKLGWPIMVVAIESLFARSYALEVELVYQLICQIKEKHQGHNWHALAYDSGAALTLELVEANAKMFKQVLLVSPWLGEEVKQVEHLDEDYLLNRSQEEAIESAWQDQDPLPKMTEMAITHLPPVHFFVGAYDSWKQPALKLYKRLRAHNKTTRFYLFERMVHDFALQAMPEADETLDLLVSELKQ